MQRNKIAHLGAVTTANQISGLAAWLSQHSDLVAAAAAFAAIYFVFIRRQ